MAPLQAAIETLKVAAGVLCALLTWPLVERRRAQEIEDKAREALAIARQVENAAKDDLRAALAMPQDAATEYVKKQKAVDEALIRLHYATDRRLSAEWVCEQWL